MDWRIKGVVQNVLTKVPGGMAANDWLQRLTGGRRHVAGHIDDKVRADWFVHMAHLNQLGFDMRGRQMLEIGTGWLPVMPLCFALAGMARCITVDLRRHLNPAAVPMTLQHLEPYLGDIAQLSQQEVGQVTTRWRNWLALNDGEAILKAAGIDYRAPADATDTGLPNSSVDLVFSNSVLEHVPPFVLDAMMTETQRILSSDGLALHNVNCGDHYAYFDRNITPIHYLRYSERAWSKWNTDLQYQNRLRAVDFLASARKAGLEIILDTHKARADLMSKIDSLPIASEFDRYSKEELCCTSIDFAARKKRSS